MAGFYAAQGHPHRRGRQGQRTPRSSRAGWASRACAGASALRDRPRRAKTLRVDGTRAARGRPDRDRRHRPGVVTADDVPLVEPEVTRALRDGARLGRRAAPPRRARQRRHARGRRQGARVRRRGHRPVPHRAHVHGRGPPAEDAGDDHGRGRGATAARRSTSCCRCSRRTSRGCSTRWRGLPVTIRLLDPPLHEFLPARRGRRAGGRARAHRAAGRPRRSSSARSTACTSSRRPTRCSARAACGSAILHPEIYEMQVRAIVRAARPWRRAGDAPAGRDHDPAGRLREGARADARAGRAACVEEEDGRDLDLTDRHDDRAAARLLRRRPDRRAGRLLLVRHQRPHPDRARLLARRRRGQLPRRATSSARSSTAARSRRSTSPASAGSCGWPRGPGARRSPDLKLGICGEHGGDPDSIAFFQLAGLDYVSCSPYRVPIARVAAAQAADR